jgi:transposase, IS5 family
MLPILLHGQERKVWGDGGYQGQTEAIQETKKPTHFSLAERRRTIHLLRPSGLVLLRP